MSEHISPEETLWRGRQWAVTTYGLETISEPYHYYLTADQIGRRREDGALDSMLHMVEKNWLDVDDFLTTYLLALSLHGHTVPAVAVRKSVKDAIGVRRHLFEPKEGQMPMPSGIVALSLSELEKYLPEPPFNGSEVVGAGL